MTKTQAKAFNVEDFMSDENFADMFRDSIEGEKLEGNVVKGEVIAKNSNGVSFSIH